MNGEHAFRRVAGIAAIVSGPIALASWLLVSLAIEFDLDAASDPEDILTLGTRAADLFQWAWMITDTFGYALLLSPAALYIWFWLKPRSPGLVTLYTIFGFAYILIGAIVVALLGGAAPPMMRAYAEATGPEREMLMVVFRSLMDIAFHGVGALAYLLGGLWWIGTGAVLRAERRVLGGVTVFLGIMSLAWGFVMIFDVEPLAVLETLVLLLAPVWAVWLGVVILQSAALGQYESSAVRPEVQTAS